MFQFDIDLSAKEDGNSAEIEIFMACWACPEEGLK
jgi:hypothetical protein